MHEKKHMWKKIVAAVAVLSASLFLTQTAISAEYKEGVNYQVRGSTLTPHKEIREFFSFWCGHCFSLQGDFDKIEQTYPKASFERNPVSMLGGHMGPESQRALVVAKNMGIEDLYVKELFNQMHNEGNIPMSHEQMTQFMTSIGMPKDKFEREFNSFPVIGAVAQFDKWAKDADIDAVPEILVNGKYLVTMESVSDLQELIDLIGYLLEKDNVPDAK